jgi:hypothetical protein
MGESEDAAVTDKGTRMRDMTHVSTCRPPLRSQRTGGTSFRIEMLRSQRTGGTSSRIEMFRESSEKVTEAGLGRACSKAGTRRSSSDLPYRSGAAGLSCAALACGKQGSAAVCSRQACHPKNEEGTVGFLP